MTAEVTGRPIRVVLFGGGPVLEPDVVRFLARLEAQPEIDLVGAFCQSSGQGFGDVVRDLWRRRGLLALPLLAVQLLEAAARFLRGPGEALRLRRALAGLAGRLHYVPRVHDPAVLAAIARLAPDLGLSYGSPILKPKLFEIPALGTLGIHHGRVPQYRGKKTTFWAMYNGEAAAGVTIQKINAGLDTGEIVREGAVEIGRKSRGRVWSELVDLGLDLYIAAILDMKAGRAVLRPQTGPAGPLYRDPTWRHLLEFWWRRTFRRR